MLQFAPRVRQYDWSRKQVRYLLLPMSSLLILILFTFYCPHHLLNTHATALVYQGDRGSIYYLCVVNEVLYDNVNHLMQAVS